MQRARLLEVAGRAELLARDLHEAHVHLLAASDVMAAHDPERAFWLGLTAVHTAWSMPTDPDELGTTVDHLASSAPAGSPLEAVARLAKWAALAALGTDRSDYPVLDPLISRATDVARERGPEALAEVMSFAVMVNRDQTASEIAAELIQGARECGAVSVLPPALAQLSLTQIALGRYREALVSGTEAVTLGHHTGQQLWAAYAGSALAYLAAIQRDESRCLEVPSNYVMYRVGARRWLARIALTWGLVAALHGFVAGPASFATARILLGIAEAGLLPGILWYISIWFSGTTRIRVLGIYYVAVPLSTALGGPLSNWLIRHGNETFGIDGWRFMFVVEGLAAMALGVVVLFLLADRPENARWLTVDEQNALADAAGAGRDSDAGSGSFLGSLRNRTTLELAAVFLLLTFPMFAISFFVPLVATAMKDAGSSAVDIVTFVPFLLGAIASFGWSRLAQSRGLQPWRFAAPAAVGGLGVATCAMAGESFTMLVIGVTLAAIGIYAAIPIFWSIASASLSGIAVASGLALINTVGSLGGFAAGYVTGWLRDLSGSYTAPFAIMAISLALSAAIAVTRPSTREAWRR